MSQSPILKAASTKELNPKTGAECHKAYLQYLTSKDQWCQVCANQAPETAWHEEVLG